MLLSSLLRHGSRAHFTRGGHWGRAGAGIVPTTGKRALFLHRSSLVTEPRTWGIAGGAIDPGEDALTAGLRELHEETGIDLAHYMVAGETTFTSPTGFVYTTTVVRVHPSVANIKPRLNWENSAARWADEAWLDAHIDLLHPGMIAVLPQLRQLMYGKR